MHELITPRRLLGELNGHRICLQLILVAHGYDAHGRSRHSLKLTWPLFGHTLFIFQYFAFMLFCLGASHNVD